MTTKEVAFRNYEKKFISDLKDDIHVVPETTEQTKKDNIAVELT